MSDTTYGMVALGIECERVNKAVPGTRNDTLNTAAFRMGQLVAGGELTEDTAQFNLNGAAASSGLGPTEARATIRSGIAAGMRAEPRSAPEKRLTAPRAAPTGDWWDDLDEETAKAVQADLASPVLPEPVDWPAFWEADHEDRWIIEPLVGAGAQTVIYSAPKVGKSLLSLELAAALAIGAPALGAATRPTRVMYVDHENRLYGDIRTRLDEMGYTTAHDLANLRYYSFPSMPKLDTIAGGDMLMAMVERDRAELVILDTVSRVITGEENANDTWLKLYAHMGSRLKAAGVALLRLDHSGKDADRGQRGGSAKSGDVDMVWRLDTVVDGKTYKLTCEASRMQNEAKELIIHRDQDPLRHRVDAMGWKGARDAKMAHAAEVIKASGQAFNLADAKAHLRAHKVKFDNANINMAWLQGLGAYRSGRS